MSVLVIGCGVPVESEPRPLPTGEASPTSVPSLTAPASPVESVLTLWFLRESRLVPAPRTVSGPADSQDLIDLLTLGPTEEEAANGMRTATVSVVTGRPLVVTAEEAGVSMPTSSAGQVAIVLQDEFTDLLPEEQILVLGEVVTTVAVGDVREVVFIDDDAQMLGVPLADGRLRKGPVTPADYAALIA